MSKDNKNDGSKKKELSAAEQKKLEKEYANWPMKGIKKPHDNDVMYGRGGGTNHHPGNKRFRKIVEDRKVDYVNSKRLDKPLIALEIIKDWREQVPPGRFLKIDEKTGLWNDVGDKKAREKTSQALREKAPLIRKQQKEEEDGGLSADDAGDAGSKKDTSPAKEDSSAKTTRFAEGTKKESGTSNHVKKALLARDHSLGRDYLQPGEVITLDRFSWQEGTILDSNMMPAGRTASHGSIGMAPPAHHQSIGGGPPPPPDFYGRMSSGGSSQQQREFSMGRIESWGAPPFPYPPPPVIGGSPMTHQRSGSWSGQGIPLPHISSGGSPFHHQRSGSWSNAPREHSLSVNPLMNASVAVAANQAAFDMTRAASSGYWAEPIPGQPFSPAHHRSSGGSAGPIGSMGMAPYRSPIGSPTASVTPPPQSTNSSVSPAAGTGSAKKYDVDPNIANAWSGGSSSNNTNTNGEPLSTDTSSADNVNAPVPKPGIVKRDTSHQCESYETKPSIKKAALNRDNSLASNRLKEQYMPEFYNGTFDANKEMQKLSDNLEQSTLSTPKPASLKPGERMSTMEVIANELLSKPAPLLAENRVSTIDALDIDFESEDPIVTPAELNRDESREKNIAALNEGIPKPSALNEEGRLTTMDFLDLVNEPISEGIQ